MRSETVELRVDAFGVRRVLADGREEGVDWSDVTEVEVLTAKSGPHKASGGVVIVAGDEESGCLVPLDQLEPSGLADDAPAAPRLRRHRADQGRPRRATGPHHRCWRDRAGLSSLEQPAGRRADVDWSAAVCGATNTARPTTSRGSSS